MLKLKELNEIWFRGQEQRFYFLVSSLVLSILPHEAKAAQGYFVLS